MKFNPNCVRDILLECEKSIEPYAELYIEETDVPASLSKYSWFELLYHLEQCKASKLFTEGSYMDQIGGYRISNLSPAGHDLLNKIRDNKSFKKALKKGAESLTKLIELILNAAQILQ